jgi:hypothetical protein
VSNPPPDFQDFARLVLDALEAADIDYLVGGAVAVWAWAEARTTRDFDVVIDLPGERIVQFSEELRRRQMLLPPDVIIDIWMQPEGDLPLNAIHLDSGYKAELFLLRPNDAHRAVALKRRLLVDLGQPLGEVYVHSPEDLILYKLQYFALSHQTKHIRDIASVMAYLDTELDWAYIEQWVSTLNLAETWLDVCGQVDDMMKGNP